MLQNYRLSLRGHPSLPQSALLARPEGCFLADETNRAVAPSAIIFSTIRQILPPSPLPAINAITHQEVVA
jgi:hypothetical protein